MNIKNLENIPEKAISQTSVEYTESLTDLYIGVTTSEYRKKKGQFFTPKITSEFMVRQFQDLGKKEDIRVLDPCAGLGIFESAICDLLHSMKKPPKVSFDLYENDENILQFLKYNMEVCKESMDNKGFDISYQIHNIDFILSNSSIFNDEMSDFDINRSGFDIAISNPPYYKLKKESPQAIAMSCIVKGQPNIYPLFMAQSAKLLKAGGQMTVLSPRSYCSGSYFKNFRTWFFKNVKPIKIHVFESRKEVFKKYNVLQEMVILTAIKSCEAPENVIISTSDGELNEKKKLTVRKTSYKKVIIKNNDDIIMRIPTSKLDETITEQMDKLGFNLAELGLKISTGPVVPFRATDYLLNDINGHIYAPLIWMQNIKDGLIVWPIKENLKPVAIKINEGSRKILISNGNYVLIKRFSTKEGKRRLNAGVILEKFLNAEYIGIENHVNYIYKLNDKLSEDESYGIQALLNSRLYNKYFQTINGNTQVNAAEIDIIPFPSMEKIKTIGRFAKKQKDETEIEKIILKELNIELPLNYFAINN